MIVLDASVLTDLLVGRPSVLEAVGLSGDFESAPFHAPELIQVETLHALRGLARAGHVSEERAAEAVEALGVLRSVLYPHAPFLARAWELRHELTAYDAIYLAIAERIDAVLVTADSALARRARRSLGRARVRLV